MSQELLQKNVEALKKQLYWIERSYKASKRIGIKKKYSDSESDKLETLSGRFSRGVDFLVRKVFRSLDDIEFETQGTLVDVVNNAHKRNLFSGLDEMRTIRDLRNDIVHEYLEETLKDNFAELLELTPEVN